MKPNKQDINGKEIYVGDTVRFDDEIFFVKYGNYTYLGTDRIGFFMETRLRDKRQLPLNKRVEKIND